MVVWFRGHAPAGKSGALPSDNSEEVPPTYLASKA